VQDWESFEEDMTLDELVEQGEDFLLHYQRLDLDAANCKTPSEKRAQTLAKKKKADDDDEPEAPVRTSRKTKKRKY
jgi:hypothetical protein